ncbi:MAG: hypothetical protein ABR555_12565, partial [Pyrinomonadaceae bacterium]
MGKNLLRICFVFLLFCGAVCGQTASHIKFGSSLPPTCNPATGDVFIKNNVSPTQYYWCSATDTWSQVGTGTGTGNVNTTGSPSNGNLTKFSGPASITNGDLSGDISTSGSLVTTIGASKVTNTMLAGSIDLSAKVAGILPVANGGTGQNSLTANNVILG